MYRKITVEFIVQTMDEGKFCVDLDNNLEYGIWTVENDGINHYYHCPNVIFPWKVVKEEEVKSLKELPGYENLD